MITRETLTDDVRSYYRTSIYLLRKVLGIKFDMFKLQNCEVIFQIEHSLDTLCTILIRLTIVYARANKRTVLFHQSMISFGIAAHIDSRWKH